MEFHPRLPIWRGGLRWQLWWFDRNEHGTNPISALANRRFVRPRSLASGLRNLLYRRRVGSLVGLDKRPVRWQKCGARLRQRLMSTMGRKLTLNSDRAIRPDGRPSLQPGHRENTAPWGLPSPVHPWGQARLAKLKPGCPSSPRKSLSIVSAPVESSSLSR